MGRITLIGIISIFLFLSACQPTAPDAEQEFCKSLANLGESLKDFKAASAQNNQDALQAAWDDLVESYGEAQESAEQMQGVKLNDLQVAWRNLEVTVKAALGVSPTAGSIQGIEQAWESIEAAYDELHQVNCDGL